jgi:malonate transporter and related proteins
MLINIILPVFGLILVGYVAGRTSLLPAVAVRGVANTVTYLMIPALLFRAMAQEGVAQSLELGIVLAYFGGCVIILALAMVLGRLLFRLKLDQLGVFGMAAMYSNAILLGLPLIQTAFGPAGLVLQTKIIAFHALILLPVGTFLIAMGRGQSGGFMKVFRPALKETLSNPIIIGLLAGLAWGLTGLGLWDPLDRMAGMLSAAASPTALIALGATQAQAGLRSIGRGLFETLTVSLLKLVLHPLIVWFLAARVAGLPPDAVAVATVMAALPAGANVYLQAHQYNCYVEGSVNAVILTTLLSIVSLALTLTLLHPG